MQWIRPICASISHHEYALELTKINVVEIEDNRVLWQINDFMWLKLSFIIIHSHTTDSSFTGSSIQSIKESMRPERSKKNDTSFGKTNHLSENGLNWVWRGLKTWQSFSLNAYLGGQYCPKILLRTIMSLKLIQN